jgi:hypothetical protein
MQLVDYSRHIASCRKEPAVTHVDEHQEPPSRQVIEEITALYRDCPLWAVWLPTRGQRTAIRPAADRLPGPGLPLLWVGALTVQELRDQMHAIDMELDRYQS